MTLIPSSLRSSLFGAASVALLVALCGCNLGADLGNGIGHSFACAFTFDLGPEIKSDEERLEAKVNCESGADCADTRTVVVGSSFDVQIKVSEAFDGTELRVEATGGASTEGFAAMNASCRGRLLQGAVRFDELGAGALVVYADDREIDRFTVSAFEIARTEVQYGELATLFGPSEWLQAPDAIEVDTLLDFRVLARSEDGARLVGAKPTWWIEDPEIAEIYADRASSMSAGVLIEPKSLGTTTLHVLVDNFEQTIELDVTQVVSIGELLDDGGVDDLEPDAGEP